ncbi:hypothetical protein BVC80_1183g32 [Macleaya cordata]|uniref:Uncharacterized protein n=1 Tax=Macleaya cordata TaxID=56857 RepID=A0A200PQ72_MACCD|nr:hypothetical protein BVC80_1183g32 [Macleaya cordata]
MVVDMVETMGMGVPTDMVEIIIVRGTERMIAVHLGTRKDSLTMNLEELLIMKLDRKRIHASVRAVILTRKKTMTENDGISQFQCGHETRTSVCDQMFHVFLGINTGCMIYIGVNGDLDICSLSRNKEVPPGC